MAKIKTDKPETELTEPSNDLKLSEIKNIACTPEADTHYSLAIFNGAELKHVFTTRTGGLVKNDTGFTVSIEQFQIDQIKKFGKPCYHLLNLKTASPLLKGKITID